MNEQTKVLLAVCCLSLIVGVLVGALVTFYLEDAYAKRINNVDCLVINTTDYDLLCVTGKARQQMEPMLKANTGGLE